jgi:hypothetical protein
MRTRRRTLPYPNELALTDSAAGIARGEASRGRAASSIQDTGALAHPRRAALNFSRHFSRKHFTVREEKKVRALLYLIKNKRIPPALESRH